MNTIFRFSIIAASSVLIFTSSYLSAYENQLGHTAINAGMIKFAETQINNKLPEGVSFSFSTDPVQYTGYAVTTCGKSVVTYEEGLEIKNAGEWIIHGGLSGDEPEAAAAVRHFYDPTGLVDGKKYLTNRGTFWEGPLYAYYWDPQIDAIEWALGDTPKGDANPWTLAKAKENLIAAFEDADPDIRKTYLVKVFRALGEVLHDAGDMCCPPHTRNDSHAAPMGFSEGPVLGSPDPYEELFKPEWVASFKDKNPDPGIKSFCENATTIRSIHEKLAEFTNANFFTHESINGTGSEIVKPVNREGTYPSPDLKDLEYNSADYGYYKTFPSGNRVKLCGDKRIYGDRVQGAVTRRGYPRADEMDCVESQAKELVPDMLCAGAHIIRLFIPVMKVEITGARTDGAVTGKVRHTTTDEYSTAIFYNGKINLYNAKNNEALGTVDCIVGNFSATLTGLKENDELYATLEIGGICYKSAKYTVKSSSISFSDITIMNISIHAFFPIKGNETSGLYDMIISNLFVGEKGVQSDPILWNGTAFSLTYSYTEEDPGAGYSKTVSGTLQGEVSDDGRKLISMTADHTDNLNRSGQIVIDHYKITLQNLNLDAEFKAQIQGDALKNVITSVYYSQERRYPDRPNEFHESNSIDYNRFTTFLNFSFSCGGWICPPRN